MNANELADELEACFTKADWNVLEAATMLRAQADLIDCLRMGQPNIDYDKELLKPTFVGRELTDNEIVWLWCDCEKDGTEATYIKFARAILTKAQKK